MPGFDGTGPRGQGSRSGRGMGRCKISPYCDHCPFNQGTLPDSTEVLESKERFLEKMLEEIRAEKKRKI